MFKSTWSNCKYGISNLIKWFSTVWKDRDWDRDYLYKILQKKLEHMENSYRYHAVSKGSEKLADQMKKCSELITNLLKEAYNEKEFIEHDKKWGRILFESKKEDNEKRKIASKEFQICLEKEDELRQKDKKELFKILRENIDKWWD